MIKVMLKIALIVAVAFTLTLGIGQCANDFITPANATSDWKECATEVMMLNTSDKFLTYKVVWLDHDVPALHGQPLDRCGGELAAHKSDLGSKAFRLCPGRHMITWSTRGEGKAVSKYIFMVTSDTHKIILTPTKPIVIIFSITSKPKEAATLGLISTSATVQDIQKSLWAEEAIKQALKDNYQAFTHRAKVTTYGKSVLLHTSYKKDGTLYTMSIRGNAFGIVSIDFTKQITVEKGVIDIYYEGVRGSNYYCYAKQLVKTDNCKQVTLPASSIFEQVIIMLFKGGGVC
ncbi:hypothetical protein KA005_31430 [bacterium]|nr:hypothetical protein [bacterium]